ncbi:DeoR/GlpR family DNA-binding transcription regulator [Amnibacterium sp. CER49]|uniref:DeoR/GlpR family DNA-binding transcription regulator n=1 Tax=Amnibacterium sp. CER49 TaxID=3039161 RepID=UPI002449D49B|nr:DeoR/GlpR family DNA-binding transcription regulator [Amnibacterium sp. CER49]MDH2444732.1 DeoR/GlpR family DNA-binding transcription regulator [Amnibacterium sp. CER49]
MYATERHHRILEQLDAAGRVSVASLARSLDVTGETIRRDLDLLEGAGVLRRVHGGAVRAGSGFELGLQERTERNSAAKRAIARAALALVPRTVPASVALDAGSTTGALADLLADWSPEGGTTLDVVTNAMPLVLRLQDNRALAVHAIGGVVRPTTSAAVGAATVEGFARLRPDLAFVGANGLSASFGLSTPDEREAAVKAAMVRSARRTIALVDSSKHGEESFMRFAELADIDTLVTDRAPDGDLAAALAAADVEVVVA